MASNCRQSIRHSQAHVADEHHERLALETETHLVLPLPGRLFDLPHSRTCFRLHCHISQAVRVYVPVRWVKHIPPTYRLNQFMSTMILIKPDGKGLTTLDRSRLANSVSVALTGARILRRPGGIAQTGDQAQSGRPSPLHRTQGVKRYRGSHL